MFNFNWFIMMKINDYSFGKIKIDDITYRKDLIIGPDTIIENWWRKEGHSLCMEDLEMIHSINATHLIIGSGDSGMMKVPGHIEQELRKLGYEVLIKPTKEAVLKFNELYSKQKTIGAFHLTC